MKIKVITVATQNSQGLKDLCASMDRVGMDYTVLGLDQVWRGFGTKIILTRDYLRTLEGYTHFIFVDAYDTLFLKPITDYDGSILFSCEKHPWPDPDAPYPAGDKPWRFLNSGSYIAPINIYLAMVDQFPTNFHDDDQRYFTNIYLNSKWIKLDTDCKIFQSYAFETPGDFTITGNKLINNITGSEPSVIHFNGKCHNKQIYHMIKYSTLKEVQNAWQDTPEAHSDIHETFKEKVNEHIRMNEHRTFVENHIFGFGERSFHWLWYLIIQEMPAKFSFLEIGVLKGQTLSLVEMLANEMGKKAKCYGVTPLSTEGGVWESDYKADIEFIHDKFGLAKDYTILNGLSEDPEIIKKASKLKLDILYVDGGHSKEHVINDLQHYSPLVKLGGYMVIDDACNSFRMPFGYFQGIEAVTRVVDDLLPPRTPHPEWEFICSVVHNRVYQKVK